MLAIVTFKMIGQPEVWSTVRTTRDDVRAFVAAFADEIDFLRASINLNEWYYTAGQWYRAPNFRYVPNRPDLWHIKPRYLKWRSASSL